MKMMCIRVWSWSFGMWGELIYVDETLIRKNKEILLYHLTSTDNKIGVSR